jgi:multidrug efflux pump subunit AcrA (membrane-fusion protein)|tara:strand:- start:8308 stop:9288 length:981 start_codon:yes stop_codon:yes gene_type:complete
MKMNIIKNIKDKFFSIYNSFNRDNVESILEALAINNYSINKASYILYWSIASFTVIFTIWSLFASVDQVVRAVGEVVPTSKVHVIQSPISGVVEAINTKMSEEVEKGEILFLINNTVTKTKYKLAKATKDAQKRKVELIEELVKRGSEAEIRLIDEKLALYNAEDMFQKAELNMKHSQIISPVKGTISGVDIVNIDQIVAAGDQIATIVPYNDTLQIEAMVQPKDIAYVVPGLKARLAFSAYDMSIYGQFDGVVKKVAPNTTQKNPNDPSMYKIIIEINLESSDKFQEINLQSGMMVDISIIGQSRTVASYIINPITKLSKTALRD